MNRRQLAFIVTLNAVLSLAIAILVNWVAEMRRPDLEELAALMTPAPQVIVATTPADNTASTAADPAATVSTEAATQPEEAAQPNAEPVLTGNEEVYTVQSGDSLSSIAGRFNVTVNALMAANNLDNPDYVFVGQQLVVPSNGSGAGGAAQPGEPNQADATATPIPAAQLGVLVSEISGAGNIANEAVLLVNESNSAVILRGWTLGKEGGPVYTFGSVNLFPGGSIRLHTGNGEQNSVEIYWGRTEAAWPSGSVVRLVNAEGDLVESYTVP